MQTSSLVSQLIYVGFLDRMAEARTKYLEQREDYEDEKRFAIEKEENVTEQTIQGNHDSFEKYENDLDEELPYGVPCTEPPDDGPNQYHYEEPRRADLFLCKICYQEERGSLFLPCTHVVACKTCAEPLKVCFVCQKIIQQKVAVILS